MRRFSPTTGTTQITIGNIGSGALGYGGTVAVTPEPASLSLLAVIAIAGSRRR